MGIYIGVDVGGTNIKAGMVDDRGNLLATTGAKTMSTQEEIMSQVCQLVGKLMASVTNASDVAGIGVAVPGSVDVEAGVAIAATNLPWNNLPIVTNLGQAFGLPARLENDTDAGVLGESLFGLAKGKNHALYIALGTGVGGGLLIDGRLYRGSGGAGEIGHMIVLSDGPMCKCGTRGCLEALASGPAIVEAANQNGDTEFRNSYEVFQAAAIGHDTARAAVDRAGKALACACISVSRLLTPEVIIIGGGVTKAGQPLLDSINAGMKWYAKGWYGAPVLLSLMADSSGVLGAAAAVALQTS